ncbi:IPT/TIG domain-containing protein, partial [Prosthecobacter algae]|uniref:RCC1 domain-containing protein n=1 Tax=Prosthecobacter algae TaxID=1144682 RepID=UPI0031EC7CF6
MSAPHALRGLFAALIFSFPQLQAESPVTSEDRGGVAGKSQQLSSPDQVPEGLAKSDWQSIRAAHKAWEHSFLPTKDGWQARNAGQQWTTQFDGRGFLAKPKAAEWQWGLELRSYGFGQQQRAVQGKPVVKAEGQRLSYQWDADVQEWFVNDQRGLEHGFTVARRPAGAAADAALEVVLGTRGTLKASVAADAQTIYFRDGVGAPVVTYAGLKVWDADGQVLPSRFVAGPEGGIILRVDESAARYPITIDPIAQQAYLKPLAESLGYAGVGDQFGYSVAVSGDTVVVGAIYENSSSTGINSTPDEGSPNAGAAYVFVRSAGTWSQQAYLKASQITAGDNFGFSVAVSGDTVVVGANEEDSGSTGINSTPNEGVYNSGAAYVFVRSSGTWSQQAYLKASEVTMQDNFGHSVAVSGDTVVVGANLEDSSTTGINSTPNEGANAAGAAYVFVRSSGTWSQQAYLKASQITVGDNFGFSVAVDGDTVVVGSIFEDSSTTGVNSTPNELVNAAGAAYVFVRSGSTWSQQAYLKASQVSGFDWFGYSVAVSGDTVVVGSIYEDSSTGINSTPNEAAADAGAAYVFVRSSGTWSQQAYLKASQVTGNDLFGRSVAVSGDTVVVGSYREDSSSPGINSTANEFADSAGAAYVFVRSSGVWTQQAYLKASQVSGLDFFGYSVAVSGDTVVVGAYLEDGDTTAINGTANELAGSAGAAYVFVRSGGTWTQQAYVKPTGPLGHAGTTDLFGNSVAVSGDTVVVGAHFEDSSTTGINSTPNEGSFDSGAAYVFVRSSGVWTQQAYLKASEVSPNDFFGFSVAVSGNTVVIGVRGDDSSSTGINSTPDELANAAGAAYVFVRSSGTWSQQAYLKASQVSEFDEFGISVAISGDTVVVGASGEASSTTGINSTPDENASGAGAAYVFVRSSGAWSQQAYLKASEVSTGDQFGWSVGVSEDTVVVGALNEASSTTGINSTPDEGSPNSGAAYVFVQSSGIWSQQAYLKASEVSASDQFGWSVAVSGDTVVVGAPGEASSTTGINSTPDEMIYYAGAAYVFVRSGGDWSQQAYLKASQVSESDNFGWSVATSGDTVVVGATGEASSTTGINSTPDEFSYNAGAAYVFVRNSGDWTQQAYLKASQVTENDYFGWSVAVSGDTVVVGANLEDGGATSINSTPDEGADNSGAAYIFSGLGPEVAAPTVTNVSPANGSNAGGTVVTITGTDFTNASAVTFGGTNATSFTVESATQITATTPARSAGTVSVLVTTPSGTNVANTLFTYFDPILTAAYSSATDVPVTAVGYTASGKTVNLSLGFAPTAGTQLTVVNNTGLAFINGVFDNLAQGQTVTLSFGGEDYEFVANYYGGTGNDLVLVWKNNRVLAWGNGSFGKLGNSSTADSPVPVAVTQTGVLNGKTVIAGAAGDSHSIVLCSDGTVLTWGRNNNGQLGNNSTTDSSVPVAVTQTGVLSGKTVIAVTVGIAHSLALCSDGTLAAWGSNGEGRLGNNSTTQSTVPVAVTMTGVLSGKTVVAIAAGASHNLVLCSDGTLAAWGLNTDGQLGNNSTTNSLVPVAVTQTGVLSGKTVTAITAGYVHNVVLCSDGTLASWGNGAVGRLGHGLNTGTTVPVAVTRTGVLSGKTVSALATGAYHSVVLCTDGTLAAWGFNTYGQLGNNTLTNSNVPVLVTQTGVLSGKTVVAVKGGGYQAFALCSDGTVTSWGRNNLGQLGDNTLTNSSVPVVVDSSVLAAGERFNKLLLGSAESQHSLALAAAPATPPIPAPTVTNVAPATGSTAGGTSVMITGTGFTGASAVTFGGTNATSFTVNSATQITATTPARAAGAVSVLVTTPGGTNAANTLYTYLNTPPTLASISKGGTEDTTVTFTAADFTDAYSDFESSPLASITIASLPATGVLKLSGSDVTASQVILAANLANLTYVPAANENGAKTFTVTASDGAASSSPATTVTMTLMAVNDAPTFALASTVSSPAGASWTARETNRTWRSITSSADGSKLAAVAQSGQIYTSTDSGINWTARESDRNWFSITSSADGNKLAAVVQSGQIYTSTDSGVTWTPRESSRNWSSITSSADGSKLAAVEQEGRIYTSTDSGVTWTPRDSNRSWISITSSADGSKLAAVVYSGQIYTSTDSGVTWTARESSRLWSAISSSADGNKLVSAVDSGQIYTSTDSGVTWTPRESDRSWFSIASSADGGKLAAVAVGGQIYTSTDSGVSWTARENNRNWRSITSSADGGKLAAVAFFNRIYTSAEVLVPFSVSVMEDAGAQSILNAATNLSFGPVDESAQTLSFTVTNNNNALFSMQPAMDASGTLTFTPADDAHGTATVSVTAVDSGGASSTPVQTFTLTVTPVNDAPSFTLGSGELLAPGTVWVARDSSRAWQSVVSSTDGTKLAAVANGGQIYTSTDSGATWTAQNSGSRAWTSVASSADGTRLAATVENGGIYTSADSGVTWTLQAGAGTRNWSGIACSEDGSKLVAGGYFTRLYTSSDYGVTWTPRDSARQWAYATSSADGTKLAFVEGGGGPVWTSSDSGQTWTPNYGTAGNLVPIAGSSDGTKLVTAASQHSTIWTSTNSGSTWTSRASQLAWSALASSADGTKLFAAVSGGLIYTSTDSGVTWVPQAGSGSRLWRSLACSADGTKVVGIVIGGQIYTSTVTAAPYLVTVAENAGPQTVPNVATNISPGPSGESGQAVSFTVTNNNNALFSVQPVISSAGTLTFTSAPSAYGSATVSVVAVDNGGTADGGVDRSAAFTFTIQVTLLAPTVTNVAPAAGSTAGGTVVTITGMDFMGATAVTFGGMNAASYTVDSDTQITATTPARAAGAVSVLVTTPIGTNAANTLYTYVTPPTVTNVSPATGSTLGGTPVTITGTNLTGASAVTIGGTAATSVTVVSDTSITAVTPAGSAGPASVIVTTSGGSNAANSLYTYVVPNFAPTITSNGGDATASIDVAENSTAVTTVTATDTNTPAQTLTYTKSGADAGFFTLNPTSGALSFTSAPNFEAPADSGLNNIYEVTVTVTDSGTPGLTDTQAISVIVTDVNEGPAIKPSSSYLAYETVNPSRDGAGLIVYTTNNAATLAGLPFNRVRYRMDNTTGGVAYYADASFDAWSGLTVDGLKVPDAGNILTTQRNVTNVSIRSNHPRVVNSNTEQGRLELWTSNYSPPGIIGGSATLFDYDDTPGGPIIGYGSFQLHNLSATVPETVFAWNNHAAGVIPDVGFGNATIGIHPDWTFTNTGTNAWRMQIYIENNFVPPTMSFTEDVVGNILFFNSPFLDD